jgi:hypothetical protein
MDVQLRLLEQDERVENDTSQKDSEQYGIRRGTRSASRVTRRAAGTFRAAALIALSLYSSVALDIVSRLRETLGSHEKSAETWEASSTRSFGLA